MEATDPLTAAATMAARPYPRPDRRIAGLAECLAGSAARSAGLEPW
ncbi:MAG TPA: hypothetical protein VFN52_02455 [Acidiferrobacteraceae bacterium]|nr:hypothetical protein [Acidiferrobacteraceae bacterium]